MTQPLISFKFSLQQSPCLAPLETCLGSIFGSSKHHFQPQFRDFAPHSNKYHACCPGTLYYVDAPLGKSNLKHHFPFQPIIDSFKCIVLLSVTLYFHCPLSMYSSYSPTIILAYYSIPASPKQFYLVSLLTSPSHFIQHNVHAQLSYLKLGFQKHKE